MNKQQPMKTYTLISFHDGNDTIDIEADNLLDASLDALDSLGWRLNSLEDSTGYKVMLAASELLTALETMESVLDGPIGDILTGEDMAKTGAYDALERTRAAIAKATNN